MFQTQEWLGSLQRQALKRVLKCPQYREHRTNPGLETLLPNPSHFPLLQANAPLSNSEIHAVGKLLRGKQRAKHNSQLQPLEAIHFNASPTCKKSQLMGRAQAVAQQTWASTEWLPLGETATCSVTPELLSPGDGTPL